MDTTGYRIERKDYSVNPWRVVYPDGATVYRTAPATDGDGRTVAAPGPLSAPTKIAAVALLGQYAADLAAALAAATAARKQAELELEKERAAMADLARCRRDTTA